MEATIILICSAYKLCHAMAFNVFCHYLQSRRCKICVFVFELTIEGQAPLVLVVGQQRGQHVHLVQGRPGTQRKTLSAKEENRFTKRGIETNSSNASCNFHFIRKVILNSKL